ncbi:MAG: acetoacetate--CoA ligase [Alphaproteobacteria bacterium]|nr:acetoacetate--CoA ligase [Alphaproteobacteria bacterium]
MTLKAQQSPGAPAQPLWSPAADRKQAALLTHFMAELGQKTGEDFETYQQLWDWSVSHIPEFWSFLWDHCDVIGEKGDITLENSDDLMAARFFPKARLNYAENLLRNTSGQPAIIFRNERAQERIISFQALNEETSRWQQAFIKAGIQKGDRIAAYMPNMPETLIAMLAATSLGAIWSSASPDFGAQGVIDRFGQIEPKILIAVDGYYYGGKTLDCLEKLETVKAALPGLAQTIIVPFVREEGAGDPLPQGMISAPDFLAAFTPKPLHFERVEFNHPLFIMFSSGTTGVPKCIVHGHGGTLLQHLKEHRLHSDIRPGDKTFYFTTCGWMMWNWLVSALASEACLMLYDGSPFYPGGNALWDYADAHECTFFGTSAKYIDALKTGNFTPRETHNLSSIRTIASTGSPLVHESFDYVYSAIKADVHLASISGGTDIVSCFMLGNPISPVWRGELQCAGLGMAVDIFDEDGQPVLQQAGELVCTKPFPARPVKFWGDEQGEKYKAAYFDTFPNIWCHGDWVEKTQHDGFIVHGRSDATLNPGGVRIGTAEIYRQVEQVEAVRESICVGQDWEGDVRVLLFVVLKNGWELDDNLVKEIKTKIRNGASPRHVPAKVIAVKDIPRTRSGKITELAVRDVIMGRKIRNMEALANPEALALYEDMPELQT